MDTSTHVEQDISDVPVSSAYSNTAGWKQHHLRTTPPSNTPWVYMPIWNQYDGQLSCQFSICIKQFFFWFNITTALLKLGIKMAGVYTYVYICQNIHLMAPLKSDVIIAYII